jgi:hypothetical protein
VLETFLALLNGTTLLNSYFALFYHKESLDGLMELTAPLVNHMTDVMAGETCQGKLMGNLYQENYLFTLRAQGILHNMTYFLNKYRRDGFPVADRFFNRCLRDFKEIASVGELHFQLSTCDLVIGEKSQLNQLRGKHLLEKKVFTAIKNMLVVGNIYF